jgi:hypothetical protein
MIVGSLINSALSYMSMHHFKEAKRAVNYTLENYWKDPEVYFRKA